MPLNRTSCGSTRTTPPTPAWSVACAGCWSRGTADSPACTGTGTRRPTGADSGTLSQGRDVAVLHQPLEGVRASGLPSVLAVPVGDDRLTGAATLPGSRLHVVGADTSGSRRSRLVELRVEGVRRVHRATSS